jgi:hypothetical protein
VFSLEGIKRRRFADKFLDRRVLIERYIERLAV